MSNALRMQAYKTVTVVMIINSVYRTSCSENKLLAILILKE
jgi:hypothetical protein